MIKYLWIVIGAAALLAVTTAGVVQTSMSRHAAELHEQTYVPGEAELRAPVAPAQWYAGDTNFTSCIPSTGPGPKILEIRDSRREPEIRDEGAVVEVAVEEGLETHVWTYYASKDSCEQALAREHAVPDRYFSGGEGVGR